MANENRSRVRHPVLGEAEFRERLSPQDIQWFAGLAETAMSFSFDITSRRLKKYASPVLSYNDNNGEAIERMQELFGGRLDSKMGESQKWKIEGRHAIQLALAIEQYAPSRLGFINLLKDWEEVSAEERHRRARAYIDGQRNKTDAQKRIIPNDKEYDKLIKLPAFAAGVFDKGGIVNFGTGPLERHRVRIDSPNQQLLRAMERAYGGSVPEEADTGSAWMIEGLPAAILYQDVKPYLRFRAEQAKVFEKMNPRAITDSILFMLAENTSGMSTAAIAEHIKVKMNIPFGPRSVLYLFEHLSEGQVVQTNRRSIWQFALDNPRNFYIVERSRRAMERYLKSVLRSGIVISPGGSVIAVGARNADNTVWFGTKLSEYSRSMIRHARENGVPFEEITDHGRTFFFVPKVEQIIDMRQLGAVRGALTEAIENALKSTVAYYAEFQDDLPYSIVESQETVREIMRASGSR